MFFLHHHSLHPWHRPHGPGPERVLAADQRLLQQGGQQHRAAEVGCECLESEPGALEGLVGQLPGFERKEPENADASRSIGPPGNALLAHVLLCSFIDVLRPSWAFWPCRCVSSRMQFPKALPCAIPPPLTSKWGGVKNVSHNNIFLHRPLRTLKFIQMGWEKCNGMGRGEGGNRILQKSQNLHHSPPVKGVVIYVPFQAFGRFSRLFRQSFPR